MRSYYIHSIDDDYGVLWLKLREGSSFSPIVMGHSLKTMLEVIPNGLTAIPVLSLPEQIRGHWRFKALQADLYGAYEVGYS